MIKILTNYTHKSTDRTHLDEERGDEEPRGDGVPRGEPACGEDVGHDLEGGRGHRVAVVRRGEQQHRQLQEHQLQRGLIDIMRTNI